RALLEGQKKLLACMERKRQAIGRADIGAITEICTEENALAQRIGELEKHRLRLVGAMTEAIDPAAARPATLGQIVEVLEEESGRRLLAIGAELREAVGAVRKQSTILRSAADALARHMSGIAQTVHSALSRAGVYGRGGTVAMGAQLEFSVDLKS
ncbi:MAG: flagellar export chaperone FlgN, partial [Phycisphaerales bacterium]